MSIQDQKSRIGSMENARKAALHSAFLPAVEWMERRILLSSYTLTQAVALNTSASSQAPESGVTLDSSGNVFGEAYSGGSNSDGSLFELAAGSSTITTLANFNGSGNGSAPQYGSLVLDSNGDLFGVASAGGASSDGTVFELAAGSSTITALADFNSSTGTNPYGNIVRDSSGDLFGDTNEGGPMSEGTVWELASGHSTITVLASFDSSTIGFQSYSGVTGDSSGDLFGTTNSGGPNSDGVVWELASGNSTVTAIAPFNGTNGSQVHAGVTLDSSGDMFGTGENGGTSGFAGVIWEIPSGATSISVIHNFQGQSDGEFPYAGVTLDPAGNLLGTTENGGGGNAGAVYELNLQSSSFTDLLNFNYSDNNGNSPYGAVTLDSNGNVFGTTEAGGPGSEGTLFELGVIPSATKVSLQSSQSPVPYGTPVTFTATVTAIPTPNPPNGTVTFTDVTAGDTVLGTATAPTSPGADTWSYATMPNQLNITSGDVIIAGYNPGADFDYVGSSGQTTQVVTGTPTLTSITPNSVTAGSGNTTIALIGSGFDAATVAQFNGVALTTTVVNSTTLTAVIPSSDLTSATTATITANATDVSGGTSSGLNFTVNANTSGGGPATSRIYAYDPGGAYNGKPKPASGYVAGTGGVHIGTPSFVYYLASDKTHSHPLPGAPTNPGSYVYLALFPGNSSYAATITSGRFTITIPVTSFATVPVHFVAGAAFNGTVAQFSAPTGLAASYFSASINWGDGKTSNGTVVETSNGKFKIVGMHTWAKNVTYTMTITLLPAGSDALTAKGPAT